MKMRHPNDPVPPLGVPADHADIAAAHSERISDHDLEDWPLSGLPGNPILLSRKLMGHRDVGRVGQWTVRERQIESSGRGGRCGVARPGMGLADLRMTLTATLGAHIRAGLGLQQDWRRE